MKKTAFLVLFLLTAFCATSLAADSATKPKKRTADEEKKLTETRKQIEVKKLDLNGTSWELTMVGSADPKINGTKDTFIFQDGQFKSTNLAKRGFVMTNYTVSIPSATAESAVWETMQTGKEGMVFIRGEWTKDSMNGSISEQLDGGKKSRDYRFTTSSRKSIPKTAAEEETKKSDLVDPKVVPAPAKSLVSKEKK